jgi:hypothetical protein
LVVAVVAGWLVVVVVVVADERGAECARATPPLHSILRAPEQQHGQHHFLGCKKVCEKVPCPLL